MARAPVEEAKLGHEADARNGAEPGLHGVLVATAGHGDEVDGRAQILQQAHDLGCGLGEDGDGLEWHESAIIAQEEQTLVGLMGLEVL
jgi:hypothetical protein